MELFKEVDLPVRIKRSRYGVRLKFISGEGLCLISNKVRPSRIKRGPGKGNFCYRNILSGKMIRIMGGKHRGFPKNISPVKINLT